MELIERTIDMLAKPDVPLESALTNSQIIAKRLDSRELYEWVLSEVRGYSSVKIIPEYRRAPMLLFGMVQVDSQIFSNVQLSTIGVPEAHRKLVNSRGFIMGIGAIQQAADRDEDSKVAIVRELYPYLAYGLSRGASVVDAHGLVSKSFFLQVVSQVRSRLLDLLLGLSDYIPDGKQGGADMGDFVKNMFNNAVIGDRANFNFAVGSNNSASVISTKIKQGDWKELVEELNRLKVRPEDVTQLKEAIQLDKNNGGNGYGQGVRGWLSSMILKAGTPAWEIPAQVGAGVLIECLNNFFGA